MRHGNKRGIIMAGKIKIKTTKKVDDEYMDTIDTLKKDAGMSFSEITESMYIDEKNIIVSDSKIEIAYSKDVMTGKKSFVKAKQKDVFLENMEYIRKNLCTGKKDKEGALLFTGDVIKNDNGLRFEIRFGEFAMYCPVDDCMMENVGFFCVADGYYEDMPLGPTQDYATKIGNIYENPELAVATEYRCQAEYKVRQDSIYGSNISEFQKRGLTTKEIEVVKLLAEGMNNKEISRKLKISEQTTKNHVHSIFKKTNFKERTQVALWALKVQIGENR